MAFNYLWSTLNRLGWTRSTDHTQVSKRHLLTSLGLAVIDDIHLGSGAVVKDVLGGSGTYCESHC